MTPEHRHEAQAQEAAQECAAREQRKKQKRDLLFIENREAGCRSSILTGEASEFRTMVSEAKCRWVEYCEEQDNLRLKQEKKQLQEKKRLDALLKAEQEEKVRKLKQDNIKQDNLKKEKEFVE